MEKTIQIINQLKKDGVINDYAIGGAMASIFYTEPIATYDLDIFFVFENDSDKIITLSPIYKWMNERGYTASMEYIMIEGMPVQFIPAYNKLVKEAVSNSIEKKIGRIKTKVINIEYLIAIMLDTYRAKDKERIIRFIDKSKINRIELEKILSKFSLKGKFEKIKNLLKDESR